MVFHLKVIMPFSLTVELVGGLGNQLFQLAALLQIARRTNRLSYIQSLSNPSPHSSVSYFDTIFQTFKPLYRQMKPLNHINDPKSYVDWNTILRGSMNTELRGYFQDWRYVDRDFISKLVFPTAVFSKYPVQSGIFLHIRGGDYVGNSYHDIGLDEYYARAIKMFPDAHFFIVTNDLPYAMSRPYLTGLSYTIIDEPELETLYLMSQCAGGICANSSFSWWGAFLNANRKIVMPDRWFVDRRLPTDGYYFPGVIKCPV